MDNHDFFFKTTAPNGTITQHKVNCHNIHEAMIYALDHTPDGHTMSGIRRDDPYVFDDHIVEQDKDTYEFKTTPK